jgi:hypothetical protein
MRGAILDFMPVFAIYSCNVAVSYLNLRHRQFGRRGQNNTHASKLNEPLHWAHGKTRASEQQR